MDSEIILTAKGDLISSEVEAYKEEILETLAGNPQRLILDMGKVKVIDSSGIGMLIAAKNSASKSKCELVLKDLNADILKMFKIMRLTEHFVFIG